MRHAAPPADQPEQRHPACTAAIDAAVAPWRRAGQLSIEVVSSGGPPAILTWRDWHEAAGPVCALVEREAADATLIVCAADAGLDAARSLTSRPVLGAFRCAVAAAAARAERFGVVAMPGDTPALQRVALRSMGLEGGLAGTATLDVPREALQDRFAARGLLIDAAMDLAKAGAGVVVLCCTGMAAHRVAMQDASGLPVIDFCEAGIALAVLAAGWPGRG